MEWTCLTDYNCAKCLGGGKLFKTDQTENYIQDKPTPIYRLRRVV
ncbi:hypothetical protein FIU95_14135 [Microbulbifer sp. THAF38]|nr:hypothetical protein FIU95_14135 [Microbulbifer sp. THAF38]